MANRVVIFRLFFMASQTFLFRFPRLPKAVILNEVKELQISNSIEIPMKSVEIMKNSS